MEINLRSLAFFTDLHLLRFEGRVEDRGDYYLGETPDNPSFFWGNLMVMKSPPKAGDLELWTKLFIENFSHQPLVKHITFGWDTTTGETGEIGQFEAAGFSAEPAVVLTATESDIQLTAKMNRTVQVRPLLSDADWEAATANQVATRKAQFREEVYLPYKRKQMARYRRMSQAGHGNWYGTFLNDRLVADCGVFIFDGIGRYQTVGTHPDFQRQGMCSALIYHSAKQAFSDGAKTLVMVAEPDYHAADIYKSVGFRETQRSYGACKFPEEWKG